MQLFPARLIFGAAGTTVTDERKLSVDFRDTYATASQVIIVTKHYKR